MTTSKDRIAGVDTQNMAEIYEIYAKTMPDGQIYRELITNSLEAGARMKERDPNFKGMILIGESATHPNKLCVMDNCEGMPKDKILPLTGDLAATYKQSEAGNFGHGTKAAAFANNKYGVMYHSLFIDDEGEGSAVRMYFNGKNFAAKHYEAFDSCIVPLDKSDFPKFIQEAGHGNITTLLGNSEKENTILPPLGYDKGSFLKSGRVSPIHWQTALTNTKFFEWPDYMTIKVEAKREGRTNYEKVHGHKYMLNQYSSPDNRGILDLKRARIHWWLMSDNLGKRSSRNDCVLNGQLAILHKKEIIKIDYNCEGGKNPLKSWGLPFSYKDVALVVEFKNFQANVQRTTLYSDEGREYTDYIPEIRQLFQENMPRILAANETRMQREYSKKLLDNEGLGRKVARYLKNILAIESEKGDETVEESLLLGGARAIYPNPPGPRRPPRPKPTGGEFGSDPVMIGIKNLEGKKKARKARPNPMPQFVEREDKGATIEYDYDNNICYLYKYSPLFDEYANLAHLKVKGIRLDVVREFTMKAIQDILGTRIAIARARDILTEDKKRELLTNEDALLMSILSPFEVVDRVIECTKHLDKRQKELNSQVDKMVREDVMMKHEAQLRQI